MFRYGPETSDMLVREFLGTGHIIRMIKNWGVIGGIAAAVAVGVYVLWGPTTEKKKKKRGMVPGLLNLGNTCFLNSLLQGLAACPSFIKWLEKLSCLPSVLSQKDKQLSITLLQLLKALSSDEPGNENVLDAGCLLDVLRLYRWHISSFEEQDAHELFHVLTSSLEEERDCQPKVAHLFDMHLPDQGEETMTCSSRAPLHPIPSPWKFQHPFHGRLTSNMSCKRCEQQSPVRYDSFESLSLSIPVPQWGRQISIDQCLQHFISSETIKEVECENCTKTMIKVLESQRTTFVKHLKLGKLPQCLCIHLQRLTWSSEGTPIKRQEHVQFSEYLSMDRYKHNVSTQRNMQLRCTAKSANVENTDKPTDNGIGMSCCSLPSYSFIEPSPLPAYYFLLTAVLVHHGDMHSGHFVTYRRSPSSPRSCSPFSSQWLWVSDDSVRKASLQEVLSSNAYMLFYERVQRPILALHSGVNGQTDL
uniref:Ubiquitin carboxyl-terminal hydrolase n=1 Tax=Cynoglossus semilaevis TaxID=244447 RepID=A0A3P8VD92_CYNSE